MPTLGEKQREFTKRFGLLIGYAYSLGFGISLGEAWRTPEMAAMYARQGKGIRNSLHIKRLAVDINLFRGSVWLQKYSDYKILGEFWESLSTPGFNCAWGGRFRNVDSGHFSIEHEGIR